MKPVLRRGRFVKELTKEEKNRRQKKIKSVRHLAENIHRLRSQVTKDLKSKDEKTRMTALAVALMDKTYERVGNDASAKDGHFGVTGFQNQHVTVNGDKVTIKYVGKSGVKQDKSFTDKMIAKMLKECKGNCDKKSSPVLQTSDGFHIKADKVNRYLKDFDITAKDIRGYSANQLMVKALKNGNISSDEEERKKKFREVLKNVADAVGHQHSTLRLHYLLPNIETEYVKKKKVINIKNASAVKADVGDVLQRIVRTIPNKDKAREMAKKVLKYDKTKNDRDDISLQDSRELYRRVDFGQNMPLTKKRDLDVGWTDHAEYRSELRDIDPRKVNQMIKEKLRDKVSRPDSKKLKFKAPGVGTAVTQYNLRKNPADARIITVYGSSSLRRGKTI
jgi:DNA topoisomerase-1